MAPPDDLRRIVLDASLELIATHGVDKLSMREVARRAGVSHQAPYHHFGDRSGILAAIVHEGFARLHESMRAALVSAGEDEVDRLVAIGKGYVGFALRNTAHFKLMFRTDLVSRDTHSPAFAREDESFELLLSVTNALTRKYLGRADRMFAINAWGLAHGLATLLLEGKLTREFGTTIAAQEKAAARAIIAYCRMFRAK